MDHEEKKKRTEELDRFWDIDTLIPPKRAPRYAHNTDTVEIVSDDPARTEVVDGSRRELPIPARKEPPKPRFIPPHSADELKKIPPADEEYEPKNALIRRVRLYRWKSNYHYYEEFVRDAVRLYAAVGHECPPVAFFSYVPQYAQMSRPQLEWYLWWRTNVRRGVYLL